jgi:hypothetical protein
MAKVFNLFLQSIKNQILSDKTLLWVTRLLFLLKLNVLSHILTRLS